MSARLYLNTANPFQRRLIILAGDGRPFIVECTDESMEPHYEGHADVETAHARAAHLTSSTGFSHGTFKIEVDGDGDFWTDYKHI